MTYFLTCLVFPSHVLKSFKYADKKSWMSLIYLTEAIGQQLIH